VLFKAVVFHMAGTLRAMLLPRVGAAHAKALSLHTML
jgi:hypothetical protein